MNMLPVEPRHDGRQKREATEFGTRRELIQAIVGRYHSAVRSEKKKILDEFVNVTGFHRKHAIRALKRTSGDCAVTPPRSRIYDEAVRGALTILWEAADRICGKRLKEAIPTFVAAMERHGHLQLDCEVRRRLLEMSPATIDRLLSRFERRGGKAGGDQELLLL
jgi:hypothetical protein